jgi:site-specific DNA-methyltransferase (adenine-specific)
MGFRLINGECLEEMAKLEVGSIDMILTDPPYGTTQCKWDSIIPLEPMWEQLKRATVPKGAMVLFGSEPFSSIMRCSNLGNYRYDWVWQKRPVNFLNAKKQPLRKTERISVFGGGTYHPQGLIYKPRVNKRSNSTETNGLHGKENIAEYTNYPTDVLEFIGERGLHPTQKPVALMEYLIKTYTDEGETVLDFTMGSGTTGVACLNLNRNFVGIELDEKYFRIAADRIGTKDPHQDRVQRIHTLLGV